MAIRYAAQPPLGNDANDGLSAATPKTLLTQIAALAASGDTIRIVASATPFQLSALGTVYTWPAKDFTIEAVSGSRVSRTEYGWTGSDHAALYTNGVTIDGWTKLAVGTYLRAREIDFTVTAWPAAGQKWSAVGPVTGVGSNPILETVYGSNYDIRRCRFYKGYGAGQTTFDTTIKYDEMKSPSFWKYVVGGEGEITSDPGPAASGTVWPGHGDSDWATAAPTPAYNTIAFMPGAISGGIDTAYREDCLFHDIGSGVADNVNNGGSVDAVRCLTLRSYNDMRIVRVASGKTTPYASASSHGEVFVNGFGDGLDGGNPHCDVIQHDVLDSSGTALSKRYKWVRCNSVYIGMPGNRAAPQNDFGQTMALYAANEYLGPVIIDNISINSAKAVELSTDTFGSVRNPNVQRNLLVTADWFSGGSDSPAGTVRGHYRNSTEINTGFIADSIIESFDSGTLPWTQTNVTILGKKGSRLIALSTVFDSPSTEPTTFEGFWNAFKPKGSYVGRSPHNTYGSMAAMIAAAPRDLTSNMRPFVGFRDVSGVAKSTATTMADGSFKPPIIHGGDPGDTLACTWPSGLQGQVYDEDGTTVITAWSQPATVPVGKRLDLKMTSSPDASTAIAKTVTIGGVDFTWTVETASDVNYPEGDISTTQTIDRTSAGTFVASDGKQLICVCQFRVDAPQPVLSSSQFFFGSSSRLFRWVANPRSSNTKYNITAQFTRNDSTIIANATTPDLDFGVRYRMEMSYDLNQGTFAAGFVGRVINVDTGAIHGSFTAGGFWASADSFAFSYASFTANTVNFFKTLGGKFQMLYLNCGEAWTAVQDCSAIRAGATGKGFSPTGKVPEVFVLGKNTVQNRGTTGAAPSGGTWAISSGSLANESGAAWPPLLTLKATVLTAGPYLPNSPIDILVYPIGRNETLSLDPATNASGTFAADPVAMAEASNGVTVTYTPTAAGSHTISFTNDLGYTNPSSVVLSVDSPVGATIPRGSSMSLGMGLRL